MQVYEGVFHERAVEFDAAVAGVREETGGAECSGEAEL